MRVQPLLWVSLLAAGCFRTPEAACADYLARICRCGGPACEAASRLVPAAVALAERAGEDPARVCAERAARLRCGAEEQR